jgi:hypothetical protein
VWPRSRYKELLHQGTEKNLLPKQAKGNKNRSTFTLRKRVLSSQRADWGKRFEN